MYVICIKTFEEILKRTDKNTAQVIHIHLKKVIDIALNFHNKCAMDPDYNTIFKKDVFESLLIGKEEKKLSRLC